MTHEALRLLAGPTVPDAAVRLIVWCKACGHRVEPDVADQVERHGADTTVIDWASRLRCPACGEREVDFVVSGARR
ncbi:MAG: YgiT-type zinc finger protein [Alphaproteobacteria bacterium]